MYRFPANGEWPADDRRSDGVGGGDYGLAGRMRYGQIPMLQADSNAPQIKAR